MANTISHIIAIILMIVGAVWAIYTLWRSHRVKQVSNWPTTQARVSGAKAQPLNSPPGVAWLSASEINPASNTKYIPHILYKYSIESVTYESEGLEFQNNAKLSGVEAQNLLNLFPEGSEVTVRYNPKNPAEAYIYSGKTNYNGVWLGLLILLASGYWYYAAKNNKMNIFSGNNTAEMNLTELAGGSIPTFRKTLY